MSRTSTDKYTNSDQTVELVFYLKLFLWIKISDKASKNSKRKPRRKLTFSAGLNLTGHLLQRKEPQVDISVIGKKGKKKKFDSQISEILSPKTKVIMTTSPMEDYAKWLDSAADLRPLSSDGFLINIAGSFNSKLLDTLRNEIMFQGYQPMAMLKSLLNSYKSYPDSTGVIKVDESTASYKMSEHFLTDMEVLCYQRNKD